MEDLVWKIQYDIVSVENSVCNVEDSVWKCGKFGVEVWGSVEDSVWKCGRLRLSVEMWKFQCGSVEVSVWKCGRFSVEVWKI